MRRAKNVTNLSALGVFKSSKPYSLTPTCNKRYSCDTPVKRRRLKLMPKHQAPLPTSFPARIHSIKYRRLRQIFQLLLFFLLILPFLFIQTTSKMKTPTCLRYLRQMLQFSSCNSLGLVPVPFPPNFLLYRDIKDAIPNANFLFTVSLKQYLTKLFLKLSESQSIDKIYHFLPSIYYSGDFLFIYCKKWHLYPLHLK